MTESLYDEECFLRENIEKIKYNIAVAARKAGKSPEDITLVAATKTVKSEIINLAIKNGIDNIGENRVQELLSKFEAIDKSNLKVHFIGHLQKNKVKDVVGKVDLIHSVDSFELAEKISKISEQKNLSTSILLQVNIGNDMHKFGVDESTVEELIFKVGKLPAIKLCGLMTILPLCENKQKAFQYFNKMRNLFVDMKSKNMDNTSMEFLSMGMSSDYITAIECGANIVRVGSALFGARQYKFFMGG